MTLADELSKKVTPLYERESIPEPQPVILKMPEYRQLDGRRRCKQRRNESQEN